MDCAGKIPLKDKTFGLLKKHIEEGGGKPERKKKESVMASHLLKCQFHHYPTSLLLTRRHFAATASSVALDKTRSGVADHNLIEPSLLPTYYFQKSLPRLPIPKLEDTCRRYLESLKPLVTPEMLNKTEKLLADFQKGQGQVLHKELVEQDKVLKQTSYISAPWFEMYLKDRNPLPINTNPALVFVEDNEVMVRLPKAQWQLVRTTNLLVSSLRFMKAMDSEVLEPEVFHLNPKKSDTPRYRTIMKICPTAIATYASYLFKAFPLDMSQFPSLFRTTRIPGSGIDQLQKADKSVRHIVVMRKGHFYAMNCLDESGNILPPQELMGSIHAILNDNISESETPVGLMTTENRDKWASIREKMISRSSRNQKSLQEIDSALFVLSLDEADDLGEDPVKIIRNYLHSTGTNRWFDKSFNMITTKDGSAGLNFEHAWGDGVAVMRFFNDIDRESKANQWVTHLSPKSPTLKPVRLVFEVDEEIKNALNQARERINKHIESLDVDPFILEKYGKIDCKKWGISPDSLMQLGFQVAYQRVYANTATTYESCSTSAFKHGRTEAIRPATDLTKEISEALAKSDWSNDKGRIRELIKKCSEKHGQLTKDAAMGQGFDRHLFAMKHLCVSKGRPVHDLYSDDSYKIINQNILSTSTLSSPAVRVGGFGPVVQNGFGIAYQIWDTGLGCIAATYKGQKSGSDFVQSCQSAFNDIHSVMTSK